MGNGSTQRIDVGDRDASFPGFQERWRSSLVIIAGGGEGTEYALEEPKISLGRGPGADLCFDDAAMSREHAVIEFAEGGYRVRDVGSTNGTRLNGAEVVSRELSNGDRLQLGEHVFQFVLEHRDRAPKTYVIPED